MGWWDRLADFWYDHEVALIYAALIAVLVGALLLVDKFGFDERTFWMTFSLSSK